MSGAKLWGAAARHPVGTCTYLRCLLLEGTWGSWLLLWEASFWFRSCKGGGGW